MENIIQIVDSINDPTAKNLGLDYITLTNAQRVPCNKSRVDAPCPQPTVRCTCQNTPDGGAYTKLDRAKLYEERSGQQIDLIRAAVSAYIINLETLYNQISTRGKEIMAEASRSSENRLNDAFLLPLVLFDITSEINFYRDIL